MSNQNALYEIVTKMEKDDYRKFSYLGLLKDKKKTGLQILLLSAVGAMLFCMIVIKYTFLWYLAAFIVLIVTSCVAICLKVEYKAINREGLIRAGLKGNRQYLNFFEHYLTASEDVSKDTSKIKYENLHEVQETKDYLIIYASVRRASLIRKKDIDESERESFATFLKNKMGKRYTVIDHR